MKASINDLLGKYYGTIVVILGEEGQNIYIDMTIKNQNDPTPSDRQIKEWGLEIETFTELSKLEQSDCQDSSHYETKDDFETASKICEAINSYNPK